MLTSYSDITCMVSNITHASPDEETEDSRTWSLSFKPDQDLGFLFPYINAERDDALWYEHPEHVKFLFKGYRCILYPDRVAVHFFETRQRAMAFITQFMNFLDTMDRKKQEIQPNFNRIRRLPVMDIFRLLPGSNCRECGFSTCMAFAAAVTKGKTMADQCPGMAAPMRETAVYPVVDGRGKLTRSVSLTIDTSALKQRIQDQEKEIQMLKAQVSLLPDGQGAPPPFPIPPDSPAPKLTDREIQVLALIAQGYTNNEIGHHLFISPHTVKSHMINIFNKFSVSDRTQAAVMGVRYGMI